MLLIAFGAVAALCLGVLTTVYVVYDQATQPDRGSPGVAVRQYLGATFDDRNEVRARLFTCGDPADIKEIQALLADTQERESRFKVSITVTWGSFDSTVDGSRATVTVELKIQVPVPDGGSSRSIQRWSFATEDRSGWRVCDAHKLS